MKRWVVLPLTGTGTSTDPIRPDFQGVKPQGYVMAAYNGTEALVKIVKNQLELDEIKNKVGVTHKGDETLVEDEMGNHYEISTELKDALKTEAQRLGINNFDPRGYDVGE